MVSLKGRFPVCELSGSPHIWKLGHCSQPNLKGTRGPILKILEIYLTVLTVCSASMKLMIEGFPAQHTQGLGRNPLQSPALLFALVFQSSPSSPLAVPITVSFTLSSLYNVFFNSKSSYQVEEGLSDLQESESEVR